MKSTQLIAVTLLSLVSAVAVAETVPTQAARDAANVTARNNYPVVAFQSAKTRAEVVAELVQAQKDGLIVNNNSYPVLTTSPTKTRADVKKEAQQEVIREAMQSPVPARGASLYSGA